MNYKYKLKFIPTALKEWDKLDNSIKEQFKNKLSERLSNPCVPSSRLHGFENYYKIKLIIARFNILYL
jgi:mRNA interferase RelE/StbE